MKQCFISCAAFVLLGSFGSQAVARTICVDQDGTRTYQGYCDLNGDDCTAKPLGFSVKMGSQTYNSYILYGDGSITFGNTAVDLESITNTTPLSDYGVPVIASGIDMTTSAFNADGFQQIGSLSSVSTPNTLDVDFDSILGNSSESQKVESAIDITAYADHLDVVILSFVNGDTGDAFSSSPPDEVPFTTVDPQLAGYSIAGVGDVEDPNFDQSIGSHEYIIPATVTFGSTSAAPEPSVWMMMTAGIGMAGLVLRSRRSATRGLAVKA